MTECDRFWEKPGEHVCMPSGCDRFWEKPAAHVCMPSGCDRFWEKPGEHVFMYKLIKINISINMYTKVIFITPITLQLKGAWLWLKYHSILWSMLFDLIPKTGFPKTGMPGLIMQAKNVSHTHTCLLE